MGEMLDRVGYFDDLYRFREDVLFYFRGFCRVFLEERFFLGKIVLVESWVLFLFRNFY